MPNNPVLALREPITISGIELKSACNPWGISTPGDMIGGELTKGEFMSFLEVGPPAELPESLLSSSMRGMANLLSYSSWGNMGGWAMPALPNPSKISILHAFSGAFWSMGFASRGRMS